METSVTFIKSDASDYGKRLMARAFYSKGKSFLGAAVLLEQQKGADKYVVLHLLCQGIEIILKALLLLLDYDKYSKLQRRHGHDLRRVALAASDAFKLHPMRSSLAQEIQALNNFYSNNLLRYDGLQDIFIDPATIESGRVLRRIVAAIRLTERELARNPEVSLGETSDHLNVS